MKSLIIFVIETSSLGRRFGAVTAVDDVSLEVGAGEVFGFLGPNGAGKTTTVRMLACLIAPTSGSARVCGREVTDRGNAREIRRRVGILTEGAGFYDALTVRRNLRFYADLYELGRREADRRIEGHLQRFGLGEASDRIVGGFSRGMRQKLALIRCMLHDPDVLFLDEPTAGLDPESARTVREFILRLKSEGRTIFLCTHNLDEAERLCDRVAIINRQILYAGAPRSLKHEAYGRRLVVRLERVGPGICEAVDRLGLAREIERSGDRLILRLDDPDRHSPDVVDAIVRAGGRIRSVGELGHTMEDVYLKLIGERHG